MFLGVIAWPLVGAAIGYHASTRAGFTTDSGIISGAAWGILAPLLYWFDWAHFGD